MCVCKAAILQGSSDKMIQRVRVGMNFYWHNLYGDNIMYILYGGVEYVNTYYFVYTMIQQR
jgi:hypothetical protein